MIGSAPPIRNQMTNELPLIFPMIPADRPQKTMMKTSSTAPPLEQPVQRPEDRDDGDDDHHHGCDPGEEAEHELQEDPAGDKQYGSGQELAADVRESFA